MWKNKRKGPALKGYKIPAPTEAKFQRKINLLKAHRDIETYKSHVISRQEPHPQVHTDIDLVKFFSLIITLGPINYTKNPTAVEKHRHRIYSPPQQQTLFLLICLLSLTVLPGALGAEVSGLARRKTAGEVSLEALDETKKTGEIITSPVIKEKFYHDDSLEKFISISENALAIAATDTVDMSTLPDDVRNHLILSTRRAILYSEFNDNDQDLSSKELTLAASMLAKIIRYTRSELRELSKKFGGIAPQNHIHPPELEVCLFGVFCPNTLFVRKLSHNPCLV